MTIAGVFPGPSGLLANTTILRQEVEALKKLVNAGSIDLQLPEECDAGDKAAPDPRLGVEYRKCIGKAPNQLVKCFLRVYCSASD